MPPDEDCRALFDGHTGRDLDSTAGYQIFAFSRVRDFRSRRLRILTLEKEFESSSPRSLLQWWRDRRKRREGLPFWVGLVIPALTIISLILSFISTGTGVISTQQSILRTRRPSDLIIVIRSFYRSSEHRSLNQPDSSGFNTIAGSSWVLPVVTVR